MNWFEAIDIYCERLGPGIFAEPLNATSNFAFIACGLWFFAAGLRSRRSPALLCLAGLVVIIGLGSLAFHTFANRWSMLADVLPITAFIYAYLAFALRRFAGAGVVPTAVALLALLAVTVAAEGLVPRGFLNGSAGYVPAWAAGCAMALWLNRAGHAAARPLFLASVIFAVSLLFRSVDQLLCPSLPVGTHFLWHLFNAAVLGIYLSAAAEYGSKKEPAPEAVRYPGPQS